MANCDIENEWKILNLSDTFYCSAWNVMKNGQVRYADDAAFAVAVLCCVRYLAEYKHSTTTSIIYRVTYRSRDTLFERWKWSYQMKEKRQGPTLWGVEFYEVFSCFFIFKFAFLIILEVKVIRFFTYIFNKFVQIPLILVSPVFSNWII